MAYAPATLKTGGNLFGGLVNDGNRNALTGATGSQMYTQDNTGTPVTSPVTVNTTKTLVVPSNAVQFTVSPVTNPVQVSEDSTQTAYFAVPAGTTWAFDCARMANIYLKTSGSTVVSFYFNLV